LNLLMDFVSYILKSQPVYDLSPFGIILIFN
jgi:hypothetical protein